MKKLLYITFCMIFNVSIAHRLEKVSYSHADSLEQQLQLATITFSFDTLPSVQKLPENMGQDGFKHVGFAFDHVMISDAAQQVLHGLVHHTNPYYYITYEVTSSDGITLNVYYDPRYVTYHANNTDGINFEQAWVLQLYNVELLDMHQRDDKPLIQFAYYSHDKYKTSCFLV